MEYVFTTTSDGLQLPGFYYPAEKSDVCILLIHGMSGFFLENYFGHIIGETAQENGYGYIYTHNRGYSHINDIATNRIKADGSREFFRGGEVYERFEDCVIDIEAWLAKGRQLGYKKFVIIGHSLGGPKVVHHYFKQRPKDIVGMVLASPADMVGLVKKPGYQSNYSDMLNEAHQNVENGQPEKLLSWKVWDWYLISSQTFLDLFEDGCPADVLPLLRNPERFPELESVDAPILCLMGEHDDIAIRTLPEDMELLKSKALESPRFDTYLLAGANHCYDGREKEFAQKIVEWVKDICQ